MSDRTDRNRPLYMISVAAQLAGVIRILDLQGRLEERDTELDDLHKRVRRLADRVHELETRESVNALVRVSDLPTALRQLP